MKHVVVYRVTAQFFCGVPLYLSQCLLPCHWFAVCGKKAMNEPSQVEVI